MHVGGERVQVTQFGRTRGEPSRGHASLLESLSLADDSHLLDPQDAVTSLSFSPHTPTFLTGSADKTLKLWDYRTGTCLRTLLGNRDVVHAVAVSRDGRIAVSGSEDGTVRTFRLDEERRQ